MSERITPSVHQAESHWRNRVEQELKSKSFDSLIHSIGNEQIKPIYFDYDFVAPARSDNQWWIHEELYSQDVDELNTQILTALQGGAQSIGMPWLPGHMHEVLKDVYVQFIRIHLRGVNHAAKCLSEISKLCDERELPLRTWNGTLDLQAEKLTTDEIREIHQRWKAEFPGLRCFIADSQEIHDTGIDGVAESVYQLMRSDKTLNALCLAGMSADDASAMMHWRMGIGTDFLAEAARFRAWRILWDALISAYNPTHNCSNHSVIHAHISRAEYSLRDPHNNLLRAATAILSAVLGGAHTVSADPYTALQSTHSADRRITRNIQHLLVEECGLANYLNAIDGAHYFEAVTHAIATEAWQLFKQFAEDQTELNAFLNRSASQRRNDIISQNHVVVGSNKYVDTSKEVFAGQTNRHISAVAEKS